MQSTNEIGVMSNENPDGGDPAENTADGAVRDLSPAAQRALAEAAERRARLDAERARASAAAEQGGRSGPDPVRYGDWENGGIASDF